MRLDGFYKTGQMKTKDLQSTVNLLKLGQILKCEKRTGRKILFKDLSTHKVVFYLYFMDTYGIVTPLSLHLDGLCITPYCFKTMVRKWGKMCC